VRTARTGGGGRNGLAPTTASIGLGQQAARAGPKASREGAQTVGTHWRRTEGRVHRRPAMAGAVERWERRCWARGGAKCATFIGENLTGDVALTVEIPP
jgi:hypothetical protein